MAKEPENKNGEETKTEEKTGLKEKAKRFVKQNLMYTLTGLSIGAGVTYLVMAGRAKSGDANTENSSEQAETPSEGSSTEG